MPPTSHSTHATHPEPDLDRDPLHRRPPVPSPTGGLLSPLPQPPLLSPQPPLLSWAPPTRETAARRLQQSSSSQGRAPSLRAASSLPSPPSYVTVVVAIRPSAPQR
ncbi:hypothetical protein VPH35_096887 [Triticum aestivum]